MVFALGLGLHGGPFEFSCVHVFCITLIVGTTNTSDDNLLS